MSYAIDDATPEPDNDLVRPVALFVTLLLIAWNVTGWLLDKGLSIEGGFVAAMTCAFQLLSFNASAQMRRARDKRHADAQSFWTACLFMCSAWSAYSAHHAYGVIVANDVEWGWSVAAAIAALTAAPALVVLTAAAFIEPFLPWAIERTEAPARPLEAANDRAPAPARKHGLWTALGLGLGLVAAPAAAAADQPPETPKTEPAVPSAAGQTHSRPASARPAKGATSEAARRASARAMIDAGRTPWSVHRETGVPLSTLKGWRAGAVSRG